MASLPTKPTTDQYEQASYWVSLLHDGDCSPKKHHDFLAWLDENTFNQKAYQEVEAYWQQLDGLETIVKPQLDAARSAVRQPQSGRRRSFLRQSLALAALVFLMVIAAPMVQLCLDNGSYRTAKGEQKQILLSDGSRIDLNTETEIHVNYTLFNRKIKLEKGEALFTVKHIAEMPFEVAASDSIIRDIGTQFNVYKQADNVSVTVLEGEVSVGKSLNTTTHTLTAGMQFTFNQDGQSQLASKDDFKEIASWREGRIVFKGQRLDVVLEQLSRYHAVKLSTGNSSLASLKVSGSFPTDDLNLALNTIAASLPVKIANKGLGNIVLETSSKKK
ncbi:MAG: FecR family protein [Methylococcaceae bacterium]|nr:FecR family protein [Methylococcaceae bacterium]